MAPMFETMGRALGLGLALTLSAGGAGAKEDDDGRALAKAQFAEGQRAFDRKDFAEALRHFRRAFELHRHDAVRFNIGVCLERMGRFREALEQYDEAAKSEQLDEKSHARAVTKADAARAELGTLIVLGTPKGAEVVVGDEVLCNLPCKTGVDPGDIVVVVRDGELREERRAHVTRQQELSLTVELKPEGPEATASAPPVAVTAVAPGGDETRHGPGLLTWTGVGVAVVGGAGIAIFGPKAQRDHDEFVRTGSDDARSSGTQARNLSNVSIGVVAVGAALVVVDLLFVPKQSKSAAAERSRWSSAGFRF